MKTLIRGLLAAMATCALIAGCTPIGDDAVPEEMTGDGEGEIIILCYDGVPCTSDVLISGVAGNFCSFPVKDGGDPCVDGIYYGTCYPPLMQDGRLIPGACQRECTNSQCYPGTTCTLVGGRYACAPPGTECFSASDCADTDPCTENLCSGGQCLWRQMVNGEVCGDGLVCQEQPDGGVLCLESVP